MSIGVPEIPLFVPGVPPADVPAELNTKIRDPLTFLLDRPRFVAKRTTSFTITEGTYNPISWSTPSEDTYAGWSAGTPSRYTVPFSGWYLVCGGLSLSGTGATALVIEPAVAVNGGDPTDGIEVTPPTGAASQPKYACSVWRVYANAGEYIEVLVWYSTESSITGVDTTAGLECRMEIVWDSV